MKTIAKKKCHSRLKQNKSFFSRQLFRFTAAVAAAAAAYKNVLQCMTYTIRSMENWLLMNFLHFSFFILHTPLIAITFNKN